MLIEKTVVIENSSIVCLARVRKADGTYLQQSDVSTITGKVFDTHNQLQTGTLTLTPSGVITNTLVTGDPRWAKDATGYNVTVPVDGSSLPEGDRVYQVETKFSPGGGGAFYVVWRAQTENILSE